MVVGFETFRQWFAPYSEQYTIIGGTACDLIMTEYGADFRATKDIDMVLIVEALTPEFGAAFWEYIKTAGYEHRNKSTGEPQFYRFGRPSRTGYPAMIELFSRSIDAIPLPEDAVLTPLPLDDELSSLSAILMNTEYYNFMREGRLLVDQVSVLDEGHLIPFKAKAFLDLSRRKAEGEAVDSKNIRKHKNDVFRLAMLISAERAVTLSEEIAADMREFLLAMEREEVDMKTLGIRNTSKADVIARLKVTYGLA